MSDQTGRNLMRNVRMLLGGVLILGSVLAFQQIQGLPKHTISFDFSKPLAAEKYWLDSGLTWKVLESKIDHLQCHEDQKHFLACANVVLAIGERLGMTVSLSGQVLPIDPATETTMTEKSRLQAWEKLWSVPNRRVHFSEILKKLKNHPQIPGEAILAGIGLNHYYSVMLDPHSYYIPVKMFKDVITKAESKVTTFGFKLAKFSGKTKVIKVAAGAAADEVGIQVNDEILTINQVVAKQTPLVRLSEMLKEEKTKIFNVSILRAGQKMTFSLRRQDELKKSVSYKKLKDQVGYINIQKFAKGTCGQTEDALKNLNQQKVTKLVLDLRDNPGGQMDQTTCIAGLFLGKNKKVYTLKFRNLGKEDESTFTKNKAIVSQPVVVLVNSGSASAAELLAGALRDHGRALIAGEKTFGKGSFQEGEIDRSMPKLAFFETKGLFYFPSGATPQAVGLQPDIEIKKMKNQYPIREADSFHSVIQVQKSIPVTSIKVNISCSTEKLTDLSTDLIQIGREVYCGI